MFSVRLSVAKGEFDRTYHRQTADMVRQNQVACRPWRHYCARLSIQRVVIVRVSAYSVTPNGPPFREGIQRGRLAVCSSVVTSIDKQAATEDPST